MNKLFLVFVLTVVMYGCEANSPEVTRILARPSAPTIEIETGEHALGLGGLRLVNRSVIWRDGMLYIPQMNDFQHPFPLLIWLHGGGGRSDSFQYLFPLAEEYGVVILALDARHNTWDGIDSPFGPDVEFIDEALRHTFERVAIDRNRISLGGISDGGAYALALGRVNGDLFTHLIAFAPGYLSPPGPTVGMPRIFVAHGTRDTVYSYLGSRQFIVPALKKSGYQVEYIEFDGPHWAPAAPMRRALSWFTENESSSISVD